MLYYDGSHLRLVAWRTQNAVYWVTNTLTLSIPNSRLIAIAGSLRRLKWRLKSSLDSLIRRQ